MGTDLNPRGKKLTINGKEYEILFTINAIDEIQTETSMPIFDAIERIAHAADGNMDLDNLKTFRKVLTILLRDSDPDLTEEEVGRLVTVKEYRTAALVMLAAFGISVPEPEEDEDDEEDEEDNDPTGAGQ